MLVIEISRATIRKGKFSLEKENIEDTASGDSVMKHIVPAYTYGTRNEATKTVLEAKLGDKMTLINLIDYTVGK